MLSKASRSTASNVPPRVRFFSTFREKNSYCAVTSWSVSRVISRVPRSIPFVVAVSIFPLTENSAKVFLPGKEKFYSGI